jgi:hypothetical protein
MQYRAFARTAATLILAALGGAAVAQDSNDSQTRMPTPQVMTDTAPLPPQERESIGAVVFEQEPVLAKRAYLEQLARDASAPDTRSMGAGPSPLNFIRQTAPSAEEILRQAEEADRQRRQQRAPAGK